MVDRLSSPFREEHLALAAQLRAATGAGGEVDLEAWTSFRKALVRHLAIEERIIVPMLEARRAPELLATRSELAHDHAALMTLLVPAPNPIWLTDLAERLAHHVAAEEGPGGLYELLDRHLASSARELLEAARSLRTIELGPPAEGAATGVAVSLALAAVGLRRK